GQRLLAARFAVPFIEHMQQRHPRGKLRGYRVRGTNGFVGNRGEVRGAEDVLVKHGFGAGDAKVPACWAMAVPTHKANASSFQRRGANPPAGGYIFTSLTSITSFT